MMGKTISPLLLADYRRRLEDADRKGRAEIMAAFRRETGFGRSAAFKIFQQARDNDLHVVASRKVRRRRKSAAAVEAERKDMMIISGLKRPNNEKHYWISTERALQIAAALNLIPEGRYTRSHCDRLLAKYEINRRSALRVGAVHKLTAPHPGRVWVGDASPMNQYYMHLDGRIMPSSIPRGDTHESDILAREGKVKIWVYYMVDLCTGAWLARAYNPVGQNGNNGGENATDWRDFLSWCMLPKTDLPSLAGRGNPLQDCPMEGAPHILFTDKTSALGAHVNRTFLDCLDIKLVTHMPNRPSAKGAVEGRISAVKRSFEIMLLKGMISNIEELNYFYQAWSADHCRKKGSYESYRKHPVRRVNPQNIHDAHVSRTQRTVDAYGCVSIDGRKWFVDDQLVGEIIAIHKAPAWNGSPDRFVAALPDGTIKELDPNGPREHDFESIESFPKSARERANEAARELGDGLRKTMILDDVLPGTSNVVAFPPRGEDMVTTTPVAPERMTAEEARNYVLRIAGQAPDLEKAMEQGYRKAMAACGYVPGSLAVEYANIIKGDR